MTWNILLTEPGRDFTAAANLVARGIACYLPTYRVMQPNARNCPRRGRLVDRPLFPGYMFIRAGQDGAEEAVRASAGVRRYLACLDGPARVSDAAVAVVRNMEQELMKEIYVGLELQFSPGQLVQICRQYYPFDGMRAIIQRLDKRDRATLLLMTPGPCVSLSVATKFLAPLAS